MRRPRRHARAAAIAVSASAVAAAGCVSPATTDNAPRFPTSRNYPAETMERLSLTAPGPKPWRLNALRTPPMENPDYRVVVITGAPSWSEYWAPTVAAAREAGVDLIVADRPGYAGSEPSEAVTNLEAQAEALAALLAAGPAPKDGVILIGQSYGGPISVLMAARHPELVRGLVLVSGFFGDRGPTIRRLSLYGSLVQPILPRDLKNALKELKGQRKQLDAVREVAAGLTIPVTVLHGARDSFVTVEAAQRAAGWFPNAMLTIAPEGDHFLNTGNAEDILAAVEGVRRRAAELPLAAS